MLPADCSHCGGGGACLICEGEAGALILIVGLVIAAAVGLVAVLPYAYSWLYDMVRYLMYECMGLL